MGISFVLSTGVETPMKDGEVLSASGSRWVGAGLRMFYILAALAILSMIFSGGNKPVTNRPNFGSLSTIEWPPAIAIPA